MLVSLSNVSCRHLALTLNNKQKQKHDRFEQQLATIERNTQRNFALQVNALAETKSAPSNL